MDIRSYFQSTRKKDNSVKLKPLTSSKNQRKKVNIDSDSDEEALTKKKTAFKPEKKPKVVIEDSSDENEDTKHNTEDAKTKLTNGKGTSSKKRTRYSNTLSSSDDASPVTKKRSVQAKLGTVKTTSKFFKDVSVADVFGNEPVKRNSTKLEEVKAKVQNSAKKVKNEIKIEDDEDFDAAVMQLDVIGDNLENWSNGNEKKKTTDENVSKVVSEENVEKVEVKSSKKSNKETEINNKEEHEQNAKKLEIKREIFHNDSPTSDYFSAATDSSLNSNSQGSDDSEPTKDPLTIRSKDTKNSTPINLPNRQEKNNSMPAEKIIQKNPSPKKHAAREPKPVISNIKPMQKNSSPKKPAALEPQPVVSDINLCLPWVEKYKPDSTKKIIGQQGEKSNVNKLKSWLTNWYKNNEGNKKAKFVPSGWNKDPTGACFKAALLSGPPGVGKTTTVTLLCKELGFEAIECNASDTRSKKQLQEGISKMLTNTSLGSVVTGGSKSVSKKHVLVMDEVDGMAGNEDRGGVQELIQLIKMTKVPIICMCNDRAHPKIRSLANYCFDLRFSRPRMEQIKGYMRSVCFKEKLEVSNDMLNSIIGSSNNDVRLVLNHLSMLAANKNAGLEASTKQVKLGPWDAVRKVFSKEDHKTMTIHDKCDLFFYDYGISPLFVQENYLSVNPLNVRPEEKCKRMKLFAETAHYISFGDNIDKEIRKNGAWSLLPTQAMFASYAPGEILEGYVSGQINFPAWLGKNSKQNKIDRLLQEVQIHTRLKASASKQSINLEYAPYLRNYLLDPLQKSGSEGAKTALERLNDYDLLKEDLDSINEICNWPSLADPLSALESKVKAAFTRLYNKNPPVRAYSLTSVVKKKTSENIEALGEEDEAENAESDNEDDNADAMIMVKKKQSTEPEKGTPSTSKRKAIVGKEPSKRGRKK